MCLVALALGGLFLSPRVEAQEAEPETESVTSQGYPLSYSRWDPAVVPVCWENPGASTVAHRNLVRNAAEDWSDVSAITFTGWTTCVVNSPGIRIRWADTGVAVAALGRYLDGIPDGMILNNEFNNWSPDCQLSIEFCISVTALHEFGHALGISHEQNRWDTPTWCDQEQGGDGNVFVGDWDLDSVMNYCNPIWNGNGQLSTGDIATAQFLYPETPDTCAGFPVTIDMNLGTTIFSSYGADVIMGTPGDDVIYGGGGDDVICGRGGDDRIYGDAGDDIIYASAGADRVWGGSGNDIIYGGAHDDVLRGDTGSDVLYGSGGVDEMYGGANDDELWGSAGDDEMYGGPGDDFFRGQNGDDLMLGEGGADDIYGMSGADTIRGGAGDDELWGGNDGDFMFGEGDDDRLLGGQGGDVIDGGVGDDFIRAQPGADSVDGGSGTDDCHGGIDTDTDTETQCEDPRAFP